MKIIIVGCGKVGYALAEQLNEEGHDLTLVDTNSDRLQYVSSALDVMGLVGNGTSYHVQTEAGIDQADLLIAVTDHDEINMLSCLIAKKAGNCHTIARVRNPEYYKEIVFIKEELGLSMSINPESAAALEMSRLIQLPSAMEIDSFARGRVNLIKFRIPEGSILNQMKVYDFPSVSGGNSLICVIERNHEIIIPKGESILLSGDMVSIILPWEASHAFFKKIGIQTKPIRDILIAGGGTISYYLSAILCKNNCKVKIIEKDKDRCNELSELLPHAMIIHGDATDQKLLLEEGICDADAFASLTNLDEENILLSLYANKVSKAKLFTKINKISFEEVISEMPVGSIICPKFITAEYIIRYVRSMQNSFGSNVESLYRLMENRVEALEFSVHSNSKTIGIPIMDMALKPNLLICCINRKGKIITPSGKDIILAGDTVIVVTTIKGLDNLDDILK
ncbi:MAG: Trk system potassium transporter TrkA [Clostridiales bacterium]|nr:Trk system potassium transporter TrkA [Clostridiales bacterium]